MSTYLGCPFYLVPVRHFSRQPYHQRGREFRFRFHSVAQINLLQVHGRVSKLSQFQQMQDPYALNLSGSKTQKGHFVYFTIFFLMFMIYLQSQILSKYGLNYRPCHETESRYHE